MYSSSILSCVLSFRAQRRNFILCMTTMMSIRVPLYFIQYNMYDILCLMYLYSKYQYLCFQYIELFSLKSTSVILLPKCWSFIYHLIVLIFHPLHFLSTFHNFILSTDEVFSDSLLLSVLCKTGICHWSTTTSVLSSHFKMYFCFFFPLRTLTTGTSLLSRGGAVWSN